MLLLLNALIAVAQPLAKKVPADAIKYQQHFYKVIEAPYSWHESKAYCQNAGGLLVSIPNEIIDAFIFGLSGGRTLWIGASDEQLEGQWRWQDGSLVTYSNWAAQEPDNWKNGEDWAAIGWTSERFQGGVWADTAAHHRKPINGFICQWPILP